MAKVMQEEQLAVVGGQPLTRCVNVGSTILLLLIFKDLSNFESDSLQLTNN